MVSPFIPFGKPNISSLEIEAITRVLQTGWLGSGIETIEFEKELKDYFDTKHVVAVNSCTSALFLSLLISNIQPGDEVICPSLTWCSTADIIIQSGAKAVFCDVDAETLCISIETILPKVTSRTKAVMIVHMGGLAVDVKSIRQQLPSHIHLIEDAAHAIGAKYPDGLKVGSSENLTCFSFYANKNLSTGEGGAISLRNDSHAQRLRSLRQQGITSNAWDRFSSPNLSFMKPRTDFGYKMNFNDMQASIGRVQLKRLNEFANIRLNIATIYLNYLQRLPVKFSFQENILSEKHARHLFLIRLPIRSLNSSRNAILSELRSRNIGGSIHYQPLHMMPLYQEKEHEFHLPNTEQLCNEILTLPISASMTSSDAYCVLEQLESIIFTA